MISSNVINAISSIKLYTLRSTLVDGIPEQNMKRLAIVAKQGLEEARNMSLRLINIAIGYDKYYITGDTIMLSWNWKHKGVPDIYREVCKNLWFKKIDDINIIDILEFYIENSNINADDEIIKAIYSAVQAAQNFFKSYDRIKAVIENQ